MKHYVFQIILVILFLITLSGLVVVRNKPCKVEGENREKEDVRCDCDSSNASSSEVVVSHNTSNKRSSAETENHTMSTNVGDRPLCITSATWYGRTFNRFITISNMIHFAKENGIRSIRFAPEQTEWMVEWFDFNQSQVDLPRMSTSSAGSCFDSQSAETWYFLYGDWYHQIGNTTKPVYRPAFEWLPSALRREFFVEGAAIINEYKVRYAEEQQAKGHRNITGDKIRVATVHSRWLESSCPKRMNELQKHFNITELIRDDWANNICSYTEGYVRRQLNDMGYMDETTAIVLLADGQQKESEKTFLYRDENIFSAQITMMIMSDIHFGVPPSSIDYVIAHWRLGKPIFPEPFYQDIVQHYHPWWRTLLKPTRPKPQNVT